MKTVAYSCPFVPAEWIAAHGMRPSRILPGPPSATAGASRRMGVCPYARAFVDSVCSDSAADAVVVTTVCDQMRRASELVARACPAPVFLMHVPTTWQNPTAHKLYRAELERLGRFLVRLGGDAPSHDELAEVMLEYDAKRSALRSTRGHLSPRRYSEAVARFHRSGEVDVHPGASAWVLRGVPLALVGGPLLAHQFEIFDFIERSGAYVALDATSSGERTMPGPADRRRLRDDPLGDLADMYFGTIPDAFRRPNSGLYQWLKAEIAARGVRGIVFRRYIWCDTWHAEAQRMKEWCDSPLLTIEAEDDKTVDGRTASRIRSFVEVLE